MIQASQLVPVFLAARVWSRAIENFPGQPGGPSYPPFFKLRLYAHKQFRQQSDDEVPNLAR
jgi:hypothetical protein